MASKEEDLVEPPPAEERLAQDLAAKSPKNGIPPKRLSTARVAPPATSLTKPAARPSNTTMSPSARRPPTSVTAATAASSHRSRPSLNSIDWSKKGENSPLEEKKKSALTKRVSIADLASSHSSAKPLSSIDRRSTLGPSTNLDRTAISNRMSSVSPTKSAMKTTTKPSRPLLMSSVSRSTRPAKSSTRDMNSPSASASVSEVNNNQQSTMPALDARESSETTLLALGPLEESAPAKPLRPGFVSRKSTMSVTIEQRLREMELVNQMLRAAMAEDGDQDDETKEEYGKKADETLASLRIKLEEARRNEGIGASNESSGRALSPTQLEISAESNSQVNLTTPTTDAAQACDTTTTDLDKAKCTLTENSEQISSLQAEVMLLETKVLQGRQAAEDVSRKLEDAVDSNRREYFSKIEELAERHAEELIDAQTRLEDAEADHKLYLETSVFPSAERYRLDTLKAAEGFAKSLEAQKQDHAREIEALEERHRLAVLKVAEESAISSKATRQDHTQAMKRLENQLAHEKLRTFDAASKLDILSTEVHTLNCRLNEERHNTTRIVDDIIEQHSLQYALIEVENDRVVMAKGQDILALQSEIRDLRVSHSRKIEKADALASERISTFESELAQLHQRVRELETSADTASTHHAELIRAKDEEIDSLGCRLRELENSTMTTSTDSTEILRARDEDIASLRSKLRELKSTIDVTSANHSETIWHKDQEIETMSNVVERLQDKLQQIHEVKEREVDSSKIQMIQEHEEIVSVIRAQHELALIEIEERAQAEAVETRRLQDSYDVLNSAQHQEEYDILFQAQQRELEEQSELRKSIESLTEEKTHMQEQIDCMQLDSDKFLKWSNEKLEESNLALENMEMTYKEKTSALDQVVQDLTRSKQALQDTVNYLISDYSGTHANHMQHIERCESALETSMAENMSAANENQRLIERMRDVKAEREQLSEQLQQSQVSAEKYATRVREVEAALKVTTAELTEMKTKRANGSEFATSPAPKAGLRSSRWAVASTNGDEDGNGVGAEGDGVGISLIEGTMAGMKEQIKQLEGVNEDMLDETKRLVDMITRVSETRLDGN